MKRIKLPKKAKTKKREVQTKIYLRSRTTCIKCDAIDDLITGLCPACSQGKRHGSKS